MGVTKTEFYTEAENDLANFAKVLGHPARIAILQHILRVNTCICGDLVNEIGLAQPTISQHLKELKLIGIIKGNIDGKSVCYCIDGKRWGEIQRLFSQLFSAYKSPNECC
jgi:ArsR family transcriptional regulator